LLTDKEKAIRRILLVTSESADKLEDIVGIDFQKLGPSFGRMTISEQLDDSGGFE
jgi:hypothetical protein